MKPSVGGRDWDGRTFTLRSKWLVVDPRTSLDGGWVQVHRGRVVAIGRRQPPVPARDLGDAVLAPGLVNPHTHLEFSLLDRPIPPAGSGLLDWIRSVVEWRRNVDGEHRPDPRAAVRAGLAESVASGVTAVGEIATGPPDLPLPHWSPRLRVFTEGIGLRASSQAGRPDGLERTIRGRLDRLAEGGIAGGISPHAPYSVRGDLARRLVGVARARGLPAMVHVSESREERDFLATRQGPWRALLEELGVWPTEEPPLLSAAQWITLVSRLRRAAIVHGTFLEAEASNRLARHRDRVALVVCPRTVRMLHGTLAGGGEPDGGVPRRVNPTEPSLVRRMRDLRRAGVRVAIGTDGRGSSPDLSVRAEAATAVEMGIASPREAFGMITSDAAWAIGLDHVCGSIRIGRPADLALFGPVVGDPFEGLLDPACPTLATIRSGRAIWSRPD